MRSSLISRSPFRSSTRLAGVVAALASVPALAACDDDACGPQGAPDSGLVAGSDQVTLTFGGFTSGLNNDCPDPDTPEGIVSMTIQGTQIDGAGLVTFCVSRPDRFTTEELGLGIDAVGSDVHVVDVTGEANGCTYRFDSTRPPTGVASTDGLCENGASGAGFGLVVDGAVSLRRTCGATIDTIGVTLRGRVAVLPQPQ